MSIDIKFGLPQRDDLISTIKSEENKNLLEFAIDAANIATWNYDLQTNRFTGNDTLKKWLNISLEENLNAENCLLAVIEQDRNLLKKIIRKSLIFSNEIGMNHEFSLIDHSTKSIRIVKVKGKAGFAQNNSAIRLSGILLDVTAEAKARKKIEESEAILNILIDASDLATWDLDIKTDNIIYSSRITDIFCFNKNNNVHRSEISKRLHPDDIIVRKEALELAYKTGILKYEVRHIMENDVLQWVAVMGRVFYDPENNPIKILGTLRNITAEKNQQQELIESEKKFRLLADSMPQFVWIADADGIINYFNQSVYTYSDLKESDIANDGWIKIVHPEDVIENLRLWRHSIKTGSDFLFEHRFRKHDGNFRWQLSRAIPQKDENGKIYRWVGTSTDIEDQKNFTNQLANLVEERTQELQFKNVDLEKMNKELESFAYIASHDLQEPLRKIQTFSDLILESEFDNLTENGKDKFSRMNNAAKRMQALIEDLLLYSSTNLAVRNFENVKFNSFLKDILEELKEEILHKKAIIEIKGDCDVTIIKYQFKQLLLNIIGNALKFYEINTIPVIKINTEIIDGKSIDKEGNYFQLTIADNGIGFDEQYNNRIFEVFQRLHTKTEFKGTGIGLAIVKKIVENHQGIVTAKGEINKGATFNIYIPFNKKI